MLFILLTWLYLFFIFSVQGEWLNKILFKGKLGSIGETTLLGMIFQAIFVTIVAFFYRINIEYFCVNTILTIVLAVLIRDKWFEQLKKGFQLDRFSGILFLVIAAISLARSALLPFIIDNESYYIQAIKWLNEYGWVKGIANLHIFLSHGNPWHALQSAYNFNFLSGIFNDINGFLVCVVAFLWIQKISEARMKKDYQTNRWLFFLPVFAIFWFQFVDSPSADLPLYLISLVVIYYALNRSEETDLFAILLSVFIVFIKLSVVPILIISLFLLSKKNWKTACAYSFILGIIYMVKGIWLSGCPLAPYTGFVLPVEWAIPSGLEVVLPRDSFNFKSIRSNGLINIGLFVVVICTYVVYLFLVKRKKEQYPVLLFFTMELLLILFTYAQFRFILPAFFYPISYILSRIKLSPRILFIGIYFFIFLVTIPIFVRFNYGRLSKNSTLLRIDTFEVKNILIPSGISKYESIGYEKLRCANFEYYNPSDKSYFIFLTGDGPIPCVKTSYLRYMYRRTGCLPMLIENDLSKGFKHIRVENK